MGLNNIEYGGEIWSDGRRLLYRKAEPGDTAGLARLYRNCAVHRGNYQIKLKEGGRHSFEKTGGMYLIFGEEDIRKELENPKSFWAVLENDRAVAGCFWISGHNEYLSGSNLPDKDLAGKSLADTVKRKEGTLVYPREIIVSAAHAGHRLGRLLFYTAFEALLKAGYRYSLCDVYRTLSYEAGGRRMEVNLLNRPSYMNMLMLGGVYKGTGPVRKIALEGFSVWIEPQIFWFCHEKTLELERIQLAEKGIKVYAQN